MDTLESWRKHCMAQQTELRTALTEGTDHARAIQLFLDQHALLHSARMDTGTPWSFEDEIFDGLTPEQACRLSPHGESSIAWIIWHLARCEDLTMNLLVAGTPQLLLQDGWLKKTGSPVRDTGNAMDQQAVIAFNQAVDIEALRDYRAAVGRRTREIARRLQPHDMKRKPTPAALQQIIDEGGVVEAAHSLIDYWSNRTVTGLLLMPPTRHLIVHLNEALQLKKKFK